MAADVIATGNHYVLDVAGSVLLVTAAVLTANGLTSKPLRFRRAGPM